MNEKLLGVSPIRGIIKFAVELLNAGWEEYGKCRIFYCLVMKCGITAR